MSKKNPKPGEAGYDGFKHHFGWEYPKLTTKNTPVRYEVAREVMGKQVLYKEG